MIIDFATVTIRINSFSFLTKEMMPNPVTFENRYDISSVVIEIEERSSQVFNCDRAESPSMVLKFGLVIV